MDQEKSKRESASRQVFISYKRENSGVARSLRQALRAEGVTVWWDEELRPGDRWDERIDAVLSTTDAVVVLWSEESVNSDWVRYEAAIGRIQGNLAHARVDRSEVPAPFRSIHMEDLSAWNEREDDPSFQRLLQAIRAIRHRRLKARRIRYIRLWAVMLLVILTGFGSGWMLHTSFGRPEKSEPEPLRERLDTLFGERNWFVYPNNANQLGVTRVPAGFWVEEPIHRIETAAGDFRLGEEVPENGGASVTLRQPIRPSDIPPWQRDPLEKWQEEKAQDDRITQARVDEIFGNTTWKRNPASGLSAIGTLTKNLPLVYPVVCVDSEDGKFGVGLPDIQAGKLVTIWFAKRIG